MLGRISFILTFFILLSGCQSKRHSKPTRKTVVQDIWPVKLDVPDWWHQISELEEEDKEYNKILKTPSILRGFDSLAVRVWFTCVPDSGDMINITYDKQSWMATLYRFKAKQGENGRTESLRFRSQIMQPKSGWNMFVSKLFSTGILELKDYTAFEKAYGGSTNPSTVSVEVSTTSLYRFYQYPSLQSNLHIKDAAKLQAAIELMEGEFAYKTACQ